ncbi:hypothetical protein [Streptomyces sp. NPDC020965]|uniref:hypothetical protein n=1 Tax=Streptomyces sp. NPDC020965 TaxID=3365105 RepID=UPI0037992032
MPASPSREELDQPARFNSGAARPRYEEDGCHTAWDVDDIAGMRAEELDECTYLLTDPVGIRAEVTVDILGDQAVLWLVPHGSPDVQCTHGLPGHL